MLVSNVLVCTVRLRKAVLSKIKYTEDTEIHFQKATGFPVLKINVSKE